MKTYQIIKFKCGSLKKITQSTIEAESLEKARREGEKALNCQPNEFVGAQNL